jgi:hypothetical protein
MRANRASLSAIILALFLESSTTVSSSDAHMPRSIAVANETSKADMTLLLITVTNPHGIPLGGVALVPPPGYRDN